MTWLTWRQHRAEALTLGLLVAVLGIVLLVLGLPIHALFPSGAVRCDGLAPDVADACATALRRLYTEHGYASKLLSLFNVVPFALGAFVGAPLLARELESGTFQLAWTQGVPRVRWLAVKLAALAGLTVTLAMVFAAVVSWYRRPLDALNGRFTLDAFDLEGIAPAAYALFAFAAATAAGTMLRRSLPALAAAFAAFVVVRIAVAGWVRPSVLEPRTLSAAVPADGSAVDVGRPQLGTGNHLDWTLASGYADAGGRHLSLGEVYELNAAARQAGVDLATHLRERGARQWVEFHPAERFWTLQLIEAAVFTGLAAVLLALVVWRVRRRAM